MLAEEAFPMVKAQSGVCETQDDLEHSLVTLIPGNKSSLETLHPLNT